MGRINSKLKGWSNYFRLGTVSKAYRNVNSHVRHRVRQWLSVKFKVQGQGRRRFPDQHLHQKLGLYQLQRTLQVPMKKSVAATNTFCETKPPRIAAIREMKPALMAVSRKRTPQMHPVSKKPGTVTPAERLRARSEAPLRETGPTGPLKCLCDYAAPRRYSRVRTSPKIEF